MTTTGTPTIPEQYSYETIKEIAEFLLSSTTIRPKISIVCGTGLGVITEFIEEATVIPYEKIPHFPKCTVSFHAGQMIFGKLKGVEVMCMKGRFHYYEGYPAWLLAMPVRVMKQIGVEHMIISNAAGGLNPKFKAGDVMVMRDHVNFIGLAGGNPLRGPHDENFGSRFPAMNRAYNRDLVVRAKQFWNPKTDSSLQEGVYVCLSGSCFETIAEMKFMAAVGVDAVGMSTAPEVTVAAQCGIKCFGFSLITNMCVLDYDSKEETCNEEHVAVGKARQGDIAAFVTKIVEYIHENY